MELVCLAFTPNTARMHCESDALIQMLSLNKKKLDSSTQSLNDKIAKLNYTLHQKILYLLSLYFDAKSCSCFVNYIHVVSTVYFKLYQLPLHIYTFKDLSSNFRPAA